MARVYNISEQEKKEISEITKLLKAVPPQIRATVKGFLMGVEYTEQSFEEKK